MMVADILPIEPNVMDDADLLPVAGLRRAPRWFEDRGIRFQHDHDDLDAFEVAVLRLTEPTPPYGTGLREAQAGFGVVAEAQHVPPLAPVDFVLRRYRGAPPDTTDILLPRVVAAASAPVVRRIADAFDLPADAVLWPTDAPP